MPLGLAGFLCAAAALLDSLWLIETGRADADFAVHLELIERLDAVNQLQLLSLVAAAIAFIVWLWQAYGNMRPLGIANPRYARGWAIAGWFVPVANLVIPKLLANDVWRAGDPDLAPGERNWQARRVAPLVHWWWALYLCGGVATRVALNMADSAQSLAAARTAVKLDALGMGMLTVAALCAIAVIRQTTERQETRARALSAAAQPQPAWS